MKYRLGLDIGIASVGWSVIKLNENDEPVRIEDLGVRTFIAAENPKDGSSLALPRRIARGVRRRLRRRRYRLNRIIKLFIKNNILQEKEIDYILNNKNKNKSVWHLRSEALDLLVTNEELFRIIYHICKRRGFKSNRKSDIKQDETGLQLSAINEINKMLTEKKYRTIGEMFYKDESFKNRKRNTTNDYSNTISRKLLENELHLILTTQQKLGNHLLTNDFINHVLDIFNSQRPFASKDMIEKMIGTCTFEKSEKRAPKATFTYEKFMLLQKINSLRIKKNNVYVFLDESERKKVYEKAYQQKKLSYTTIRKILNLDENVRFKGLTYSNKDVKDIEKTIFVELKYYHTLKDLFETSNNIELFNQLTYEDLDHIGLALTYYKTDNDISDYLSKYNISQEIIDIVSYNSFSKVGHLSLKAMKKINVYLEQGLMYDKACEMVGYNFKSDSKKEKQYYLPLIPTEEITNPVVLRSLTQTRKVINAIIRKYGSPCTIHIELARDMSHSHEERRKIEKAMKENREINEKAINEIIKEYKYFNPTGHDIVKKKLWTQQNGFCIYSGKYIEPQRLFEPGYVDVDHIIPYSRSYDDSYSNKVLVLSSENRQKGNKTPYEYMGFDEKKWHAFEERVNSMNFNKKKKYNLLRKNYNEEDEREFMLRNIQDTRYATRFMMNFLKENLLFKENKYKQKVFTINGPVTSFIRKRWGLTKIREENDRHHALDATVVALISPSLIQLVTAYTKYNEEYGSRNKSKNTMIDPFTGEVFDINEYNPELLSKFPLPWKNFREELDIRLNSNNPIEDIKNMKFENYLDNDFSNVRPLFVSRMPIRKMSGQAHEETIRSAKLFEQGYTYKKTNLEDIKFDENGDFDMYGKESDPYTYEAIKNRYLKYKDKKIAFKEPLYKPKKDGSNGPIIKKVKIIEKTNTGVIINDGKGLAKNGGIVRIDIFKKDNKYYIVPIYIADLVKNELPNKVIKSDVPRKDWNTIDDTYEFMFSLQQNDLVKLVTKDKEIFGYYRKCPGNHNQIFIDQHDINNSKLSEKYGITNALILEKYTVDILGNYYKVRKEKRLGLENNIHN